MKKCIGIIGGLGPMATCDLFQKIIENTDAATDQEHLRVVIDSNTRIPDRTEAILRGGPSPLPELVSSALFLEKMEPDVLLMPCNTSHYFYDEITARIHTPLLHMPRLAVEELGRRGIRRVGLLATEGTMAAGIYTKLLDAAGIQALVPSREEQGWVTELIYQGVKADRRDLEPNGVRRLLKRLTDEGAETLLLGCTELPLAFRRFRLGEEYIDPQLILARAAIRFAGGRLREPAAGAEK